MSKELTGSWLKHHDFRFFSGEDLGEGGFNLTVKHVVEDKVKNLKTNKDEDKRIMYFVETTKGIILNTGHHRAISRLLGSQKYEDWKGKKLHWVGIEQQPHGLVCRLTNQYPNGKLKPTQ